LPNAEIDNEASSRKQSSATVREKVPRQKVLEKPSPRSP